jgi:hypothetical protein
MARRQPSAAEIWRSRAELMAQFPPDNRAKDYVLGFWGCLHGLLPPGAAAVAEEPPSSATAVHAANSLLHCLADSLAASDKSLVAALGVQQELIDFAARGVLDAVQARGTLARPLAHDLSPPTHEGPGAAAVDAAARKLLGALGIRLQSAIALPPRLGVGHPGAGAGWAEALRWLSGALASFTWAAGTEQAGGQPTADPVLNILRCWAAIGALRVIVAEQADAVRALDALGSSGALGKLRGAFARGHDVVLGMCWDEGAGVE